MGLRDKFKSKVTFGLFIGFLVLITLALAGVAIGVIVSKGQEDPILRVCVVGEKVYYEHDANSVSIEGDNIAECPTEWEERQWNKAAFPLKVRAVDHDDNPLPEEHAAWRSLSQALSDANNQFGFPVFEAAPNSKRSSVVAHWGVPYEGVSRKGRAPGYVYHFYKQGDSACDPDGLCVHIGIREVASDRLAYIILMHELGHILFLRHSDSESSVMFPVSRDDTDESTITNLVRYTDVYTDAVRRRYMP